MTRHRVTMTFENQSKLFLLLLLLLFVSSHLGRFSKFNLNTFAFISFYNKKCEEGIGRQYGLATNPPDTIQMNIFELRKNI